MSTATQPSEAPPKQPAAASAPTDRGDKFISKLAHVEDSGKNKVVIGHGSVIHPFAVLKPTNGPILIGEYCVIEEGCVIENKCPSEGDMRKIFELFPAGVAKTFGPNFGFNPALNNAPSSSSAPPSSAGGNPNIPPTTLCIGNNNHFGARVKVEAAAIGDGNTFEPMSSVGIMAVVQDGCHLRAATRVTHDAFLPSFTVVEGPASQWVTNPAVMTESWSPKADVLARGCADAEGAADNSDSDGDEKAKKAGEPTVAERDGSTSLLGLTTEQLQVQFLKDIAERAQAKSRFLRKTLK